MRWELRRNNGFPEEARPSQRSGDDARGRLLPGGEHQSQLSNGFGSLSDELLGEPVWSLFGLAPTE